MVQLQNSKEKFEELGFQIIAIAPDAPAELRKTKQKRGLSFPLLADGDGNGMRAFGVGYRPPKKKPLPVPAVFAVGGDGKILFQYVNPNYKVRPQIDLLLAAARAHSTD